MAFVSVADTLPLRREKHRRHFDAVPTGERKHRLQLVGFYPSSSKVAGVRVIKQGVSHQDLCRLMSLEAPVKKCEANVVLSLEIVLVLTFEDPVRVLPDASGVLYLVP